MTIAELVIYVCVYLLIGLLLSELVNRFAPKRPSWQAHLNIVLWWIVLIPLGVAAALRGMINRDGDDE